ncbi:MAG: hypothetical protein M1819_002171 [Sarea resinae]|nr:MAG: hypothetical protein M1819_002171 [Sarea resinae]
MSTTSLPSQPPQPPPPGPADESDPASAADREKRLEDSHRAVTASLNSVGSSLDTELRQRAQNLHSNAAAISKQEAELAKQTKGLAKQNAQWQSMADTSREKLKEIGDIQNWAELIERDLLIVEETLRIKDEEERVAGQGRGMEGVEHANGNQKGER